ncbi:MAG: lolC, partial [Rickettsiaceae bacterium]|nr:lolC [Rickettsiaceae bacterium]
IVSSLIMLVTDKSNDIAILRTMGATRGAIMRIFFLCGASIGVVGTLLGFILGLSFAMNIESIRAALESLVGTKLFDPVIYFLSELPSDVQADDVIWSLAMGLFFSFLATIYPAWKAAKQDPAEALRYE